MFEFILIVCCRITFGLMMVCLVAVGQARPADDEYAEYEDAPAPPPKKTPARTSLIGRRNPLTARANKAASTTAAPPPPPPPKVQTSSFFNTPPLLLFYSIFSGFLDIFFRVVFTIVNFFFFFVKFEKFENK